MNKKNNKIIKIIIIIIAIIYSTFIINFIAINMLKNKYGIIQIGQNMFMPIKENNKISTYKKGDLIIIQKAKINELKKNSKVIVKNENHYLNNNLLISGNVSEIKKDNDGDYILIKNNSTKWYDNSIVGVIKKNYNYLGYFIIIYSSSTVFFMLLLLPVILYIVAEICNWLKTEETKATEKELNKIDIRNIPVLDQDPVEDIINSEPVIYESTEVGELPYFIIRNITNEEPKKTEADDDLGKIVVETTIKNEDKKDDSKDEKSSILSNGKDLSDELVVNSDNNKPIEIGKGINNFVLKILELKQYEILTILTIIYKSRNVDIPTKTLKKVISLYVADKYLQPIDYTEEDFKKKDEILQTKIKEYTAKRKDLDSKQKKEITNTLIFYSTLKEDYSNIEKQIDKYIEFDTANDRSIVINYIKEKGLGYGKLRKMFASKISATKIFKIITSETPIPNTLNTQIQSNIRFSKIFSEYVIDKSYKESVVMENLEEVLLKLIGTLLVNELFEFNYKNKYIVSFSNSLYTKQRKVKNFTDIFSDPFSQKKILILINEETLKKHKRTITDLKSNGFNFVVQIKKSTLENAEFDPNTLNIGEYIIIVGKLTESEKDVFIPKNLKNRAYCVNEEINSEVVKV